MRSLLASTLAVLVLSLARPAGAADAGAAAQPKVVGPPEVKWKDMTKEQRMKFMKAVVNPKMKVTFQAFDPEHFKKFGCATCHGKDAKKNDYKMPNPEIHALPDSPEEFMALVKKKPTWPKWTDFMAKQVVPQVSGLLGLPHFDPKKPVEGAFSCNNCHVLKKGLKD